MANKLKDRETRYSAYGREALAVVDVVSHVWRVYLFGCKSFLVFTNNATLTHLLKQPSDAIIDQQVHWFERLMHYAQCTSILYCKGSVNEAE